MKKATEFLSNDQRAAVEAAVTAAEKKTSVEIVPVIATASGRYDRAEDIAGLWLGASLMILLWVLWPVEPVEHGDWATSFPLNYLGWLAALLVGFIAGAGIASRVSGLRRLFTPKREMAEEVFRRAREVFHDQRIHRTGGGTGVLIYVSLFERRVCILADDTAMKALPEGEIERRCNALIAKMKTGAAGGLIEAVDALGEVLSGPLPRSEADVDELPNALVLMD